MAKRCVVCDLPEGQTCEMCEGNHMLMSHMYQEMLPDPADLEPACRLVDTRINIGSGEDVCLA